MRQITDELIERFKVFLMEEEKSEKTIEKYIRDIKNYKTWMGENEVCKQAVLQYKKEIVENYAPASVNSMLSSLNSFFSFYQWYECKVKILRIQKQIFLPQEKELTKMEYEKLLTEAKKRKDLKLYYLLQTLGSTGIRISELKYITAAAVKSGQAMINCKGKMRIVMLPIQLCRLLKRYMKEKNIKSGAIFVTKNGNILDRSNIWKMMKNLCEKAGVSKEKVFPHNFRHLFARTYYSMEKDIVRLADLLGHSSVNTTRIYTIETGSVHRMQIQKLGLLQS